jgi:hypothetical protein
VFLMIFDRLSIKIRGQKGVSILWRLSLTHQQSQTWSHNGNQ